MNFYFENILQNFYMLDDDDFKSSKQTKQVRVNNINRVYDYCLNNVICRRTQYVR
jgi:hypothetical protein